ncbi:hypothetical protein [Salinibaculum rarum]|uniref:hypothetical protein n=1 Tax=Salinibaculum rarum TaxID=3058903 RepID=UPI00265DA6F4|nr:hypothetical protein [Salinibaculum sp. KK48]
MSTIGESIGRFRSYLAVACGIAFGVAFNPIPPEYSTSTFIFALLIMAILFHFIGFVINSTMIKAIPELVVELGVGVIGVAISKQIAPSADQLNAFLLISAVIYIALAVAEGILVDYR